MQINLSLIKGKNTREGLAFRVEFKRVRVAEDEHARLLRVRYETSHADGFPQGIIEDGRAPAGGTVRAGGDEAAAGLGDAA